MPRYFFHVFDIEWYRDLDGEDLADKSYRETVALLQGTPGLKVIVAPTSIGIVAAAIARISATADAGVSRPTALPMRACLVG